MNYLPAAAHVEALTHFQCSDCHGWWSIGDPPLSRLHWTCPWCGRAVMIQRQTTAHETLQLPVPPESRPAHHPV